MKTITLTLIFIVALLTACQIQPQHDLSFCDNLESEDWDMCVFNLALVQDIDLCENIESTQIKQACSIALLPNDPLRNPMVFCEKRDPLTKKCEISSKFAKGPSALSIQKIKNFENIQLIYIKKKDEPLDYDLFFTNYNETSPSSFSILPSRIYQPTLSEYTPVNQSLRRHAIIINSIDKELRKVILIDKSTNQPLAQRTIIRRN